MYTNPQSVKTVLAAVVSDDDDDFQGTAAELDDAIVELHINDAQVQVNTALNKRYSVPFANDAVPDIIEVITRCIACYLLDLTYRKSSAFDDPSAYPVVLRYNWAISQLTLLQSGQLALFPNDGQGSTVYYVTPDLGLGIDYLKPARLWRGDW